MNEDFRQGLDSKLSAFREWAHSRHFQGCRLVQYSGVECIGSIDIAPQEVESEIEGVYSEGFGVDWNEHQGRLYLVVCEPANLEWSWPQVFAEQHLEELSQYEPPTE